jgi:hypothetical protein
LLDSHLPPSWTSTSRVINSATYGDGVSALRWICVATRPWPFQPAQLPTIPDASDSIATPFGDFIRSELCFPASAVGRLTALCSDSPSKEPTDPFRPRSLPLPIASAHQQPLESITPIAFNLCTRARHGPSRARFFCFTILRRLGSSHS